jgi:hypothetical protein
MHFLNKYLVLEFEMISLLETRASSGLCWRDLESSREPRSKKILARLLALHKLGFRSSNQIPPVLKDSNYLNHISILVISKHASPQREQLAEIVVSAYLVNVEMGVTV